MLFERGGKTIAWLFVIFMAYLILAGLGKVPNVFDKLPSLQEIKPQQQQSGGPQMYLPPAPTWGMSELAESVRL